MAPESVKGSNGDVAGRDGNGDVDARETREWMDSLEGVLQSEGPDRARFLLTQLKHKADRSGVEIPFTANTPYINTIPVNKQPPFPGNRDIERRIKSLVRWNAMAMVVRANEKDGTLGGHISTFASCGDALRDRLQPFLPGPRPSPGARPGLLPGPCLARHLRPRLPRRPARPTRNSSISARSSPPAAACRRIRIPG